ncbi:MAG: hypothetical protein NTX22_04710 [Ignavibacteriales bacterium]|nr:hypothetical protein [Ignavibacteriales bacterium]
MKLSYPILLITLFLIPIVVPAQNVRLASMGGMILAIDDIDNSLNLYDYGNNPSWLIQDEKTDKLKFITNIDNNWGNYKRNLDPLGIHNQKLTASGIKQLSSNETFLGTASYSVERKSDLPNTLKYDTYSGEAFFMTDSATGNFIYDGPSIGFIYNRQLNDNFFAGAEMNYKILNGLKKKYSHAKTLLRILDGKFGLSYQFSNDFIFGMHIGFYDSQESIESKSEELTYLEILNYRGEKYFIIERGSTVDQKLRKKGLLLGLQVSYSPIKDLAFALKLNNDQIGTRILIPQENLINYEEGYADFNNANFEFATRYGVTKNYKIGTMFKFFQSKSWSKNSGENLLLWKWKVNGYNAGIGISYQTDDKKFLFGTEYNYGKTEADSAKYIDNVYRKLSSEVHSIKLGCEVKVISNLFLRIGYNYIFNSWDLRSGGKNLNENVFSGGFGFLFTNFTIEVNASYGSKLAVNQSEFKRNSFEISADVMINNW